MKRPAVDEYSRALPEATVDKVRSASASRTASRLTALTAYFEDAEAARKRAAAIKDYVLDNLHDLLVEFETNAQANGIQVHWASDADSANRIVLDICKRVAPGGCTIAKAKSMATEEIHLNRHLEAAGYEPVETDLGEYVVQIDHDMPSHIVMPIIHKSRQDVARSFDREGLGPYSEDPQTLAMQAHQRLREKFREAKIGVSGVNFAIAATGRIVMVENEGNNRFSTTAPDVHIALMGIEKVLPAEGDLPIFLKLLAASATGQRLTSYAHFVAGPRANDEPDGPSEVHVVLLDNRRSEVLNGKYREILRCIRCGACLNVCPVYRQVSGHAYEHVYSGPLGAVLAPALEGVQVRGALAKASSLCGACEEVCPVKIPIPRMLLQLRHDATEAKAVPDSTPWGIFAMGATRPWQWRAGLKLLPVAGQIPVPHPMRVGWAEFREMPEREGRDFRGWWHDRS